MTVSPMSSCSAPRNILGVSLQLHFLGINENVPSGRHHTLGSGREEFSSMMGLSQCCTTVSIMWTLGKMFLTHLPSRGCKLAASEGGIQGWKRSWVGLQVGAASFQLVWMMNDDAHRRCMDSPASWGACLRVLQCIDKVLLNCRQRASTRCCCKGFLPMAKSWRCQDSHLLQSFFLSNLVFFQESRVFWPQLTSPHPHSGPQDCLNAAGTDIGNVGQHCWVLAPGIFSGVFAHHLYSSIFLSHLLS